jgi:hypothetical protein
MKMVGLVSLMVVLVIAVGIVSLRLSVEGMASGIAFGGMAAATALGSFVSTYSYADDVSDFLGSLERDYRKTVAEHNKLAASPVFVQQAAAIGMANSLRTEHTHRGEAARWYLIGLSKLTLSRNPGVAGHGVKHSIRHGFGSSNGHYAGSRLLSTGRRLRGDRQ